MKPTTAGLLVACLAAGVAAGWLLRPANSNRSEVDDLRAQLDEAREARKNAEAEVDAAKKDATAARRELRAAERVDVSARNAEPAAASPEPADAVAENETSGDEAPAEPGDWKTRVEAYPRYAFEETDQNVQEALADVNWTAIANNMSAMVPIAGRIAVAIRDGEPPKPEDVGSAQLHNGPLVITAMKLDQANVPGLGPNGSFTHPAFMTNAIAANLEAMEMPLDTAQAESLQKLGADYSRRDQERLGAYGDEVKLLRRLIEEVELKADFFTGVRKLLTASQSEALSPEVTRDRLQLDVFSSGLVWAGRVQMLGFRDNADLADKVEGRIASGLSDAATKERVRAIIVDWVDRYPTDLVEIEFGELEKNGFLHVHHVNKCARQFVALLEAIERDGGLPESDLVGLRHAGGTLVPHLVTDE